MTSKPQHASQVGLTSEQVDEFEIVQNQLDRFRSELQLLAKSKANDAINTFKLSLLNKLLGRANILLGTRYTAVADFSEFDPSQLPSNSDAVLVVSQYLGALEKLRADSIEPQGGVWYWRVNGELSKIRTSVPEKLMKK